jgi:hypothetical protein
MTVAAVSVSSCPTPMQEVRRVPVPVCEPPYDDELDEAPRLERQPALRLGFQLPGGLPAVPTLRLVEPVPAADTADDPAFFEPQPTPVTALPDARIFAGRLVQAMLEVMVAVRPLAQLVRWTNEDVYRLLARRVRITGHETVLTRRQMAPGRVRSIHLSEPRDNIVEVCAIVQHRQRATAIALRLEGVDGRWQCTALQFG